MLTHAERRALDNYITRSDPDDYEPVQPRCPKCRAFLRYAPDRIEQTEDATDCDGSVEFFEQEYDERLIAILGEEYRGKAYKVAVSPCGTEQGAVHDPHRVVWGAANIEYRTCRRCGTENREVV